MRPKFVERKEYLLSLLGGKCFRCQISGPVTIYAFHHVHPEQKLYNVCSLLQSREEIFQAVAIPEAKKCAALCQNCHAIIHTDEVERDSLTLDWDNQHEVRANRR